MSTITWSLFPYEVPEGHPVVGAPGPDLPAGGDGLGQLDAQGLLDLLDDLVVGDQVVGLDLGDGPLLLLDELGELLLVHALLGTGFPDRSAVIVDELDGRGPGVDVLGLHPVLALLESLLDHGVRDRGSR